MNNLSKVISDENLPEDFLTEGVVPSKVPNFKKIFRSTDLKTLSCRRNFGDINYEYSGDKLPRNLLRVTPTEALEFQTTTDMQKYKKWSNSQRYQKISSPNTIKTRFSSKNGNCNFLKVASKLKVEELENIQQNFQEMNQEEQVRMCDDQKYVTMEDVEPFDKQG
ncbi:unnamed protein product [Moneuplotes crassus]|uniref:Uncharacterized protein n=1 Tax=Euplotes crassus TaxID=5936 RepID=A0AAD1UPV2_EUPCR|nr:unnamed protein product [Moneuplotes crassus]